MAEGNRITIGRGKYKMNWMEVALLILGVGAVAASFIIPEKRNNGKEVNIDSELIRKMIEKELENTKSRVSEVVDETLDYAVEKTERASERISNEKIMAISDYSETVLADINKAHQEVMFLYDMLNDKHKNIKETVKQVDQQTKAAKEKANVVAATLAAKEEANALFEENLQKTAKIIENKKVEQYISIDDLKKEEKKSDSSSNNRITLDMLGAQYAGIKLDNTVKQNVTGGNDIQKKNGIDSKNVEVYSFTKQAPHVERTETKQLQAENLKNSVTRIREQQASDVSEKKKEYAPAKENNNDKILKLYKAGMDSVNIAKELGLGVGEVKLVINLFKGAV